MATIQHSRVLSSLFKKSPRKFSKAAVTLQLQLDSYPLILEDDTPDSCGSAVSGRICILIRDDFVNIESFSAVLDVVLTQNRPFHRYCSDCKNNQTELLNLQFLSEPTILARGAHQFPFSAILPKYLPPSLATPLLHNTYGIHATALIRRLKKTNSRPYKVTINEKIPVTRYPTRPYLPRYVSQSFPAIGVEISAYPDSIQPNSTNNFVVTLKGLSQRPQNGRDGYAWRILNGSWSLEETITTTASACKRHTLTKPANRDKHVIRTRTRAITEDQIYDEWKSLESKDSIDLGFNVELNNKHRRDSKQNYTYDVKACNGTEVSHVLIVELIMVREVIPMNQPDTFIRTGVVKVLQSKYPVVLMDNFEEEVQADRDVLPCYDEIC